MLLYFLEKILSGLVVSDKKGMKFKSVEKE